MIQDRHVALYQMLVGMMGIASNGKLQPEPEPEEKQSQEAAQEKIGRAEKRRQMKARKRAEQYRSTRMRQFR